MNNNTEPNLESKKNLIISLLKTLSKENKYIIWASIIIIISFFLPYITNYSLYTIWWAAYIFLLLPVVFIWIIYYMNINNEILNLKNNILLNYIIAILASVAIWINILIYLLPDIIKNRFQSSFSQSDYFWSIWSMFWTAMANSITINPKIWLFLIIIALLVILYNASKRIFKELWEK